MVRKHFSGRNPIGQRILTGGQMLDAPIEPAMYVPHLQQPAGCGAKS
jgi:hypothetical protein